MNSKPKIVLFHRSVGAVFDSRIQKIMASLKKRKGIIAKAVLWERANIPKAGAFSNGGMYEVKRLPISSKKIPRPGPLVSFLEIIQEAVQAFYYLLRNPHDVVIIQNHRLFVLISLIILKRPNDLKRLVWDLRELPSGFMKRHSPTTKFFGWLLSKCDSIIVTNQARLDYMVNIYGEKPLRKAYTIPNFINIDFAESPITPLPEDISEWLKGREYFYIQNPVIPSRFPHKTFTALLNFSQKAIVITGNMPNKILTQLHTNLGDTFQSRVYMAGMIPQDKLAGILDSAYAAIVFYDATNPNNDCCDANRLYQAMARGVPVIVGQNRGLKPFVISSGAGVVIEDDGRDVNSIGNGVMALQENYEDIAAKAKTNRTKLTWESNENQLLSAILG